MSAQVEGAARRRQQILNFLHANPGARMTAIGASLADELPSRSRHHNTIRTMIEWGEVIAAGAPRCRQYWALVDFTRPADEVARARMANIAKANKERRAQRVVRDMRRRGRCVNVPDRPIAEQRAIRWGAA